MALKYVDLPSGGPTASETKRRRIQQSNYDDKLVDKKYAERGTSGAAQARKEKDAMLDKLVDDLGNIKRYGKDAPKGRSFGQKTRAAPYKKYRNGGMVEGYEYGGEVGGSCRGGGAAVSGTKFSGVK
jgi:hypothetical protein